MNIFAFDWRNRTKVQLPIQAEVPRRNSLGNVRIWNLKKNGFQYLFSRRDARSKMFGRQFQWWEQYTGLLDSLQWFTEFKNLDTYIVFVPGLREWILLRFNNAVSDLEIVKGWIVTVKWFWRIWRWWLYLLGKYPTITFFARQSKTTKKLLSLEKRQL